MEAGGPPGASEHFKRLGLALDRERPRFVAKCWIRNNKMFGAHKLREKLLFKALCSIQQPGTFVELGKVLQQSTHLNAIRLYRYEAMDPNPAPLVAPLAAPAALQAMIDNLNNRLAAVTAERDTARQERDDRGVLLTAAMEHLGSVMSSEISAGKMVLTRGRKSMNPSIKFTEDRKDLWASSVGVERSVFDENEEVLVRRFNRYGVGSTSTRLPRQDNLPEEFSDFLSMEAIKLTNSVARAATNHARASQNLVSTCLRTGNSRRDRHSRAEAEDIRMFGIGNAVDGLFTPTKTKAFNGKRARHRR